MSRVTGSISLVLRGALAALLLLSAMNFAPGLASASGEKSFTSDAYGFTLSWDSATWTSKAGSGDAEGSLTLTSDVSSVGITGFADAKADLKGCVSRQASKRKGASGVTNFKEITSGFDKVETVDGAVGRLFGFTSKGDDRAIYIECRPGENDQLIRITFETNQDGYNTELALFSDVYQTLALGDAPAADTSSGSAPSSGPTGKIGTPKKTPTAAPKKPTATATKTPAKTTKSDPVLKGNVYTGANKSYTVTFDEAFWNDVTAIEPDGTGYEGLDVNSDNSLGSVEAIPTTLSLADCLSQTITAMGNTDGFSEVVEAPDLPKPTTAKGSANTMVNFVVATDSGPANLTRYIECRTLVKGKSILRIELAAATSRVDEVLPSWTDLIAGVKVAKAAATGGSTKATATPKPKKTPKATATATAESVAFPNVDGTTYTSPAFAFTFTWPDKFTPLLASGDESGDVIAVSDGTSSVLIFSKSTSDGTTAQSCLDEKVTSLKASDTSTNVLVATDNDNNEISGTTSTGVYVLYSYTSDKGDDMYEYMRCDVDPSGDFVIDLTFITPASAFSKSVDDIQAVIDGIKLP